MKKTLITLSLLASVATLPGLVGTADAYDRGHRHGRSAWSIVRSDPCLSNEYARFAREHKNPNKRARFIERLAREGCDREARQRLRRERGWGRAAYDYDRSDRHDYHRY